MFVLRLQCNQTRDVVCITFDTRVRTAGTWTVSLLASIIDDNVAGNFLSLNLHGTHLQRYKNMNCDIMCYV